MSRVVLGTLGDVEPLAREMKPLNGSPAAYVCTGNACLPPVTGSAELARLLTPRGRPAQM